MVGSPLNGDPSLKPPVSARVNPPGSKPPAPPPPLAPPEPLGTPPSPDTLTDEEQPNVTAAINDKQT